MSAPHYEHMSLDALMAEDAKDMERRRWDNLFIPAIGGASTCLTCWSMVDNDCREQHTEWHTQETT